MAIHLPLSARGRRFTVKRERGETFATGQEYDGFVLVLELATQEEAQAVAQALLTHEIEPISATVGAVAEAKEREAAAVEDAEVAEPKPKPKPKRRRAAAKKRTEH